MFVRSKSWLMLALAFVLLAGSSSAQQERRVFLPLLAAPQRPVTVTIDPGVQPSQPTLPGLRGGPPRPVGAVVQEGAPQVEFVANEVLIKPQDAADLQAFLDRYGGRVLRDGSVPRVPGLEDRHDPEPPRGSYLVQIDPQRVATEQLTTTLLQAGASGTQRFSSDTAARLIALVTGAGGWQLRPNLLLHAESSLEHPVPQGGNLDAARWAWMTEDDDPSTPGDQGMSVGVVHAWEYLAYHNLPPSGGGQWRPPVVAIVDSGFALDPDTGIPLDGNLDYFAFGERPYQYDVADNDTTAGGENLLPCASSCPWHGQEAFGVAAARARNLYGTAGIAGTVAVPLLVKVEKSANSIELGIKVAAASGADVINVSLGYACPVPTWICKIAPDDSWEDMRSAVAYAHARGAIVVASAGNDSKAYYDDKYIPCGIRGVICVGAMGHNLQAASYSNWGPAVDIWAPTAIRTTPNPDTASRTGMDALPVFYGTSASAPFVTGVIALMRALNPALGADEALAILVETANASPDPKVTPGYVDAYRAVQRVKANQPPSLSFTLPSEGERLSWRAGSAYFSVNVDDPEAPGRFRGQLIISSDRDGELCTTTAGGAPEQGCTAPRLSLGAHLITARAIDLHGGEGTATRAIEVLNSPPVTSISYPADGARYYSSQTLTFRGSASDTDELIADESLVWTTEQLGKLGSGKEINVRLPSGRHVVQLEALDSYGAQGTSQITVEVTVGTGYPSARILAPPPNQLFNPGTPITFSGSGTDPEEGALTGAQLRWYSDLDGYLGSGTTLTTTLSGPAEPCYPESIQHLITLEATDSDGRKGSSHLYVSSGTIC